MARGYPDFEGDKSGLYLKPEWAATEGVDRNFRGVGANRTFGQVDGVFYLVPAGTTLYLTFVSFEAHANVAADADNNQFISAYIADLTAGITHYMQGGNGGGHAFFLKPIVIPAGHNVSMAVYCRANHAIDQTIHCMGYEA